MSQIRFSIHSNCTSISYFHPLMTTFPPIAFEYFMAELFSEREGEREIRQMIIFDSFRFLSHFTHRVCAREAFSISNTFIALYIRKLSISHVLWSYVGLFKQVLYSLPYLYIVYKLKRLFQTVSPSPFSHPLLSRRTIQIGQSCIRTYLCV